MSAREGRAYPRKVSLGGEMVTLRPMNGMDRAALLAFSRALPGHDLLFLPVDITRPAVIDALGRRHRARRGHDPARGSRRGGAGYAAVDRGQLDWSPHVAELRVLVAGAMRGKGLGRLLTQEAFALALELGIEKMVAQMTVDQKGAIAVFEGMGFRPEALLRDHVKDREGKKHDLLVLSHDVARFQSQMDAYGVSEALEP